MVTLAQIFVLVSHSKTKIEQKGFAGVSLSDQEYLKYSECQVHFSKESVKSIWVLGLPDFTNPTLSRNLLFDFFSFNSRITC